MAKFTVYGVDALPTSGIDTGGLYLVKISGSNFCTGHVRKNDNSDWVDLGVTNQVIDVNGLYGNVQLDLSFSDGVLSFTGSGVTVDFDDRYRQLTDSIDWSDIEGAPDFALDNTVVHSSEKGAAGGVATLDGTGKVPAAQLPSYVDDVLEYPTKNDFPATGETGKIYVALDTEKGYRWSGSIYTEISPSEVNSVFGRTGVVTAQGGDYAAFYPRYDGAQSLTTGQKAQARSNIGAVDSEYVDDAVETASAWGQKDW